MQLLSHSHIECLINGLRELRLAAAEATGRRASAAGLVCVV